MITANKKFRYLSIIIISLILAICLIFYPSVNNGFALAEDMASTEITITNSDFDSSSTASLQSTPNGWSRVGSSSGTNGVISVNPDTFSNRASSYALTNSQNPSKPYTQSGHELDNHILMINSKSETNSNESNHLGYESNDITLSAYSYYRFSIWTLTQTNARASIYIDGLGDDVENTSFESYTTNGWTEYRFYIATGINEETITLQLWLGTKTSDSTNAVFFDHITARQLSGNYFYDEAGQYVGTDNVVLNRTNIIDLRDTLDGMIENADFELGNFSGWTVENYLPIGGDAKIVSIQNRASMESLGLDYIGSSLSAQNKYALVMYSTTNDAVTVEYESTSFEVLPYETYKITIWAKVSDDFNGTAYVTLREGTDVSNFYGEDYSEDFYTPVEQAVSITSNTTNTLTNDYTPYYIYVKGHDLYKTSFSLVLGFGNSEAGATGCVIFDDITFESISHEQFDSASTTNSISVEPSILTGSPTVENGTFNSADTLDKNFEYPVKPTSWTSQTENDTSSMYGIVNTYSPLYEENRATYGNARNPGNPSTTNLGTNSDVNNVLMLYNYQETYQSVTSADISTTANSYQLLSFDYKTVAQSLNNALLSVYITDSDGNILYADEGISSSEWTNYSVMINTDTYTTTLRLMLALGTEDAPVTGYLYVDNVRFETSNLVTDDTYEDYANSHNTLDFSLTNFGFVSNETVNGIHTPYMYEQSLEDGEDATQGNTVAYGGMINAEDNIFRITHSNSNDTNETYMPAFISNSIARYTLTGKESLTLSADTYYKISIDVYTRFTGDTLQEGVEEDEKLKFGAIFGLVGMDRNFEEIVSNDEWTTYTIYVTVNEDTSIQLQFGILSESAKIQGQAFFDNLTLETIEQSEYDHAVERYADDDTVLLLTTEDTTTEDNGDNNTGNDDNQTDGLIWYVIPTAILFIALVIALCAYFMKKVTIKKWERKKASEYDRESTLYRDVVRREAEQIRDAKIKEYQDKIDEIKSELTRIEEVHQEILKKQRTTSGQQEITKAMERDFKAYASKHTKLENQIEALNAKIESFKLPEYLISIQRGIIIEKVKKEKQEKERKIKEQKAQKKAEKQKSKQEKSE